MKRLLLIFAFVNIYSAIYCITNDLSDAQVNSVGLVMIPIPAGSFEMGFNQGNWDERPVYRVTVSHSFRISKTESYPRSIFRIQER